MGSFGKLILMGVAVMSLLFSSCAGKDDDSLEVKILTLLSDKSSISANGVDKVTFMVALNGVDVTNKTKIYVNGETDILSGDEFTTTVPGTYVFSAYYEGVKSEILTINASEWVEPKTYKRHISLFKFTGTWCTFCPQGKRTIDFLLTKPEYANAHVIAFYDEKSPSFMSIPEESVLFTKFKLGGYPSVVVDMRDSDSEVKASTLRAAMNNSLDSYPAYYGVSISSQIVDGSDNADVQIAVESSVSDRYYVAAYVVENNIVYPQADGGYTFPDYVHDHVVRKIVSKTIYGDDLGEVVAGSSAGKSYSVELDPEWKTKDLSIYAFVISGQTGFIHNMAFCKVDGGQMNSND